MLLPILAVLLGFVVLYYGAEWLVSGATTIALHLNVSKVVVGLTLVAFGTSSPELFVNIVAAMRDHTDFALSNVSGSNLTNLCLGFGLCAFFGQVLIRSKQYFTDLLFLVATPMLVLLSFTLYPGGGILPFWSFALFALLMIVYLLSVTGRLKAGEQSPESDDSPRRKLWAGVLLFAAGCALLYLGGELILYGAVRIAEHLGISEAIIGLTIVAAGTSIPDVMASIIAIRRRESSIAVGNLLGSNIFNIVLVLGGTLLASGQSLLAEKRVIYDYGAVTASSLVFFLIVLKFSRLSRLSALLFIVFYGTYMTLRIITR